VGLLTGILTLPLAPVRGVVAVAEQLRQQAEEELHDPATIRAQLDAVEAGRASGELTEEQAAEWENTLIERLMGLDR
jgi:hypothetical protein